jgi:hypothetical protein
MFERPNYSRRDCLAVLAAATAGSVLDAAPTPKVPGVQLYTVRALLKKDPDATLKALAGIGFRDVEGYDRAATVALAPTIKQNGLTVRSCQIETPLITNNCRKSGLKFAWQSHAFEFGRALGIRPIEIYKERLDPKLVGMELDVFWASVAGEDPVRLLKEWKGHVPLLRLGDKAKDAPHQFSETIGQGAFVGIGDGDIDIPAIRKAAAAAGVKYEFVGQDQTTGDPIESLRKSYARLS